MPRIVHFDIYSKDPQKTLEFFSKVFGWKFETWGGPTEYWLVTTGPEDKPGINGGLSKGEPLTTYVNTIDVDSIDITMKNIVSNGGKIIQPKGPIPGIGWFTVFQAPDGNAFSLMQGDPTAK